MSEVTNVKVNRILMFGHLATFTEYSQFANNTLSANWYSESGKMATITFRFEYVKSVPLMIRSNNIECGVRVTSCDVEGADNFSEEERALLQRDIRSVQDSVYTIEGEIDLQLTFN